MNHLKKIIGLGLFFVVTIILFQSQSTYSQESESPYQQQCGEDACCASYHLGIDTAQAVWAQNLSQLVDQEKPASRMVSEGFENLRTLNCQFEYICKAVLYSGVGTPGSVEGTGISTVHIDTIPGCQAPEDLTFESGWEAYVDFLKTGEEQNLAGLTQPNQLNYIPQCRTNLPNNANPDSTNALNSYQACLDLVEKKMGCSRPTESCTGQSSIYVMLESALKDAHFDQKNRALESKLISIVNRLQVTADITIGITNKLQKIDDLYPCRPGTCTP